MAYTTINKSTDYFNTKPYTGNGGTNAITGVGFQPDWTWIKNRSQGSTNHRITDAVRGVTKEIYSDLTAAEATNTNGLTAFGSDGFTVGSNGDYNGNGNNIVSWNWKANGAGSANTAGTVNSTVSVNSTSGFSIVSWTHNGSANYTVGHGLGATPKMILAKTRSGGANWDVYHANITSGNRLILNSTGGQVSGYWGANTVNNNTFSIGSGLASNGTTMIAYCFAEKQGYSKFGSYAGNGSTDGTFVYTGFKPAFTLIKRTDSATGGSWILFDNKRGNNVRNPVDVVLAASNNATEVEWGTNYDCDYLSNGFKWRFNGSAGYNNTSGATYIYMAFAEAPLVGTNNVPCTAR